MKIAYAVFCEYARKGHNGTTDIIGIFSGIHAQTLPTRSETLFYCARIDFPEVPLGETLPVRIRFEMTSPSGEAVVSQENPISITGGVEGMEANLQLILNLNDSVFYEAGPYSTRLGFDDEWFDGPKLLIDVSESLVL